MNIYEYEPPRDSKKATGVVVILFSLAAGLFLFTILINIPFSWVLQLIAIISLTAAIFITTRYLTKSFLYSINQTDGGSLDLDVLEITNGGKKHITVCRIGLAGIEESFVINKTDKASLATEENLIKKAKQDRVKIFNYCPDINPVKYSIIIGEECGEKYLIKLTPDDKLCEYLNIKNHK